MSNKKKNLFDYILMGVKNSQNSEEKRKEADEQEKIAANKFDKAFIDKTYSVTKKVLDNVEKVADYDYESFFSRVNKVFDDKLSHHKETNRSMNPRKRAERSKEFEKNVQEHQKKFDIEDYSDSTTKNYKDSIVEKTKKNIQKKIIEADEKERAAKMRSQTPAKAVDLSKKPKNIKYNDEDKQKDSEVVDLFKKDTVSTDVVKSGKQGSEVIEEFKPITDEIKPIAEELIQKEAPGDDVQPVIKDDVMDGIPKAVKKIIDTSAEESKKSIKKTKRESSEEKRLKAEEVLNNYREAKYTKENLVENSKYFKEKKREKFAKRMSVELEDNLLVKKKRSISRLFRFSIAFKLSFVFIFLIICTVVTLSVAFYLGIDYVLVLKAAGKLEDIKFFKDVLLILLIIFDFIAILICVSVGTKTSRGLVQPIDEMTSIVKQINANEMDRRLDVKGVHDELRELAVTFNEMLDRIENSYDTQNRFTSDASHELRTPISVIQGYINMLDRWGKADSEILDESIEAIKSESNNMKKLTEKLLLLAKADRGILELDFKAFELNELISEITRETQMIDTNHTIGNEINDVKTIIADRESLKQAIRIFVDNSVKYTPDGGKISLNSYINKKKIYIEIADNGIGISKEDMDNIFNRFYRVDKSRTKESGGHGLGLSISKWIINQHKGSIEVKSELGKGTVITIILSPLTIS